jgi:hypothetical protein
MQHFHWTASGIWHNSQPRHISAPFNNNLVTVMLTARTAFVSKVGYYNAFEALHSVHINAIEPSEINRSNKTTFRQPEGYHENELAVDPGNGLVT